MSVNLKQVELIENLQKELQELRYQNRELKDIIKDYQNIDKQANENFNTMVEQRDSFIELARNLDKEFNQGMLFKKI